MTDTDDLLARIEDPSVRAAVAAKLADATQGRKLGLVFERHMPEAIALHSLRLRRGHWARRDGDERLLRVDRLTDAAAEVTTSRVRGDGPGWMPEIIEVPRAELTPVARFGDAIYPGLKHLDTIIGPGTDDSVPAHVLLNAENHHALQSLQWSHAGKVDLIYIDPPYNTGSKTWAYNDRYVADNDSFRSSKWLSFMERRLVLAHRLLKPSGAIIVSIGDDEQHRLRMLMDQVFDARNQVAQLAIEMSATSGPKTAHAQTGAIVKNVEYALIYQRSPAFGTVAHTPLIDGVEGWAPNYKLWLNEDGTIGDLHPRLLADPAVASDIEHLERITRARFGRKDMEKLLAVSEAASSFVQENATRIARTDRLPAALAGQSPGFGRYRTVSHGGRTYILTTLQSGTEVQVMPLAMNYRMTDDHKPRAGRSVIRGDLWKSFYKDMARVDKEGGYVFNNGKKPKRLIKQLVRWANNAPDAVIVDFFGGSGTTLQSVIEMNAEDGGQRQCILVTNNELAANDDARLRRAGHRPGDPKYDALGVFHHVTKPRISTVMTGKRENGDRYSDGLPGRVEVFELTYQDPERIRAGRAFEAVSPMLWLAAGGRGGLIRCIEERGWSIESSHAVLHDVGRAPEFLAALPEAVPTVYIVTDSDAAYHAVTRRLGEGQQPVRLYEKYLTTFEITQEA